MMLLVLKGAYEELCGTLWCADGRSKQGAIRPVGDELPRMVNLLSIKLGR